MKYTATSISTYGEYTYSYQYYQYFWRAVSGSIIDCVRLEGNCCKNWTLVTADVITQTLGEDVITKVISAIRRHFCK